ncbi:DoxX-like protein [Neolewinella xylanilytica]|uniref:DoxX-like protein n=1 Tax=Neolewinella xylanilytica TaxID=1514080 RepID=A0A2S6I965_9BACT|nr:DoxX family protein [Neolewinella xylanilytica]PPK88044.1 DoxX-like protein [Neolewinella xylanilytica]
MKLSDRLDALHHRIYGNRWLRYFTYFCRWTLALGFLMAGYVKVIGERFTDLPVKHPMGHFLQGFYETGYYYTFVGVMQIVAAVLLVIPRTTTLGAVIYFPIILNICILSFSVRFEGSLLTSPLMVLANLYLLGWDYHKWKYILPFRRSVTDRALPGPVEADHRFPFAFFAGVGITVVLVGVMTFSIYNIRPRVHYRDCNDQCATSPDPVACAAFCDCVYEEGAPLRDCVADYERALAAEK